MLEAEAAALRGKLEEVQRERDGERRSSAELLDTAPMMVTVTPRVVTELQGTVEQQANLLDETRTQVETLRRGERPPPKLHHLHSTTVALNISPLFLSLLELEHLKVELQSRDDEEQQQEQEEQEQEEGVDKENRPVEEQRTLTVVEELKEELQQFHKRRKVERRQRDAEEKETQQSRAFDAVQREIERQEAKTETQLQVSLTLGGPSGGAALLLQTANGLVPSVAEVRAARPSSRTGCVCLTADVQHGQQEEESQNHRAEEEEL